MIVAIEKPIDVSMSEAPTWTAVKTMATEKPIARPMRLSVPIASTRSMMPSGTVGDAVATIGVSIAPSTNSTITLMRPGIIFEENTGAMRKRPLRRATTSMKPITCGTAKSTGISISQAS